MKYFWGTVQNSKSIGLFGFLSIASRRTVTKMLKKADSGASKCSGESLIRSKVVTSRQMPQHTSCRETPTERSTESKYVRNLLSQGNLLKRLKNKYALSVPC